MQARKHIKRFYAAELCNVESGVVGSEQSPANLAVLAAAADREERDEAGVVGHGEDHSKAGW